MDASLSKMTDGGGIEVDPHGPTASKCPRWKNGIFTGKPEGPK